MSDSKKYNSIVFLTTLSVYLGLVLVGGASSPVLAQAALTRNFEIQEEIEYKDDLDKKPDDENLNFSDAIKDYFDAVEDLIKDLKKYDRTQKFDLNSEKFDFEKLVGFSCNEGYESEVNGVFVRKISHPTIETAIKKSIYNFDDWNIFADCLITKGIDTHSTHRYKTKVSYDTSQLKIEISFLKLTKQRADSFSEKFNQAYRVYEIAEKDKIIWNSYHNTLINSDNNQVFIVTRLPRGSIDSLLASTDAN